MNQVRSYNFLSETGAAEGRKRRREARWLPLKASPRPRLPVCPQWMQGQMEIRVPGPDGSGTRLYARVRVRPRAFKKLDIERATDTTRTRKGV